MEQRRDEPESESEFNLREWGVKARMVSRENTSSRRFSASNIRSFRESFRSNITNISSTASSPGYTFREEIDPSTYSFTTALKALQARSGNSWEWLTSSSPDGLALNSKWNEAEKYICNPVSGEVPTQCLSSKTLINGGGGRSFRNLAASGRITMSAPLVYTTSSHSRLLPSNPNSLTSLQNQLHFPFQEKKEVGGSMTRDVGTQSTPLPELSSRSSSSPPPLTSPAASTPPIQERFIKRAEPEEVDDSPLTATTSNLKFLEKVEVKEIREKEETKRNEQFVNEEDEMSKRKIKAKQIYRCNRQGGCFLSWRSLWIKKSQKAKHKPRNNNSSNNVYFIHHFNGCYC
ncbi:unnamed protein product [Camellia sinensis]